MIRVIITYYVLLAHVAMKTTVRIVKYSPKKKVSVKSLFISKIKSIINRYKKCRFWLIKGVKLIASRKEMNRPTNGRAKINDIFRGLDEDKGLLVRRLDAGQDLYPNCDTSIWLRNCTHEILSPVQGNVEGEFFIYNNRQARVPMKFALSVV